MKFPDYHQLWNWLTKSPAVDELVMANLWIPLGNLERRLFHVSIISWVTFSDTLVASHTSFVFFVCRWSRRKPNEENQMCHVRPRSRSQWRTHSTIIWIEIVRCQIRWSHRLRLNQFVSWGGLIWITTDSLKFFSNLNNCSNLNIECKFQRHKRPVFNFF